MRDWLTQFYVENGCFVYDSVHIIYSTTASATLCTMYLMCITCVHLFNAFLLFCFYI